MKQAKRLTRRQKSIVAHKGYYPTDDWFCVQETRDTLVIVNNKTQDIVSIDLEDK